jgi:hypothetical protein
MTNAIVLVGHWMTLCLHRTKSIFSNENKAWKKTLADMTCKLPFSLFEAIPRLF